VSLERVARWAIGLALTTAGVVLLRTTLGPVLAAAVLGPVLWLAIVLAWWSIERRHPAPSLPYRPPPQLEHPTSSLPPYTSPAQARALTELADAYIAWTASQSRETTHR